MAHLGKFLLATSNMKITLSYGFLVHLNTRYFIVVLRISLSQVCEAGQVTKQSVFHTGGWPLHSYMWVTCEALTVSCSERV